MQEIILARISACEKENIRLKFRLRLQNIILSLLMLGSITSIVLAAINDNHEGSNTVKTLETLRVKELVVVDEKGIIRARVGGNIPPAVIDGRTVSRGGTDNGVAGIMLYDKSGVERGGYVTFDQGNNIALTLDNQKKQQVFFGVGPTGTASLQLWENDELIDLRADNNGARLTRTKSGVVTHQYPEISIKNTTCQYYKGGLREEVPEGLSHAEVKRICEKKFSVASCELCLPETK
jgi:hypothetical protein